jgi:hypothetical protein
MDDRSADSSCAAPAAGLAPPGTRADLCPDSLDVLTEERDRLARDLNDTLVRQLFAVSLELHGAVSRIEHNTDGRHAAEKIRRAIDGLDQAIADLRSAVVGGGGLGTPWRHEPGRCRAHSP